MNDVFKEIQYLLQSQSTQNPWIREELTRLAYPAALWLTHSLWGKRDVSKTIAQDAITNAISKIDEYRLGVDFKSWFFRFVIEAGESRITRRQRQSRAQRHPRTPGPGANADEDPVARAENARIWALAVDLKPQDWDPLILRFLHGLNAEEIALVLSGRKKRVIHTLEEICLRMLEQSGGKTAAKWAPLQGHSPGDLSHHEVRQQLLNHPGALNHSKGNRLKRHIRGCVPCQDFHAFLQKMERTLKRRLPPETLPEEDLDAEVEAILSRLNTTSTSHGRYLIGAEVAWVVVAVATVIGIGFFINRLNIDLVIALPGEEISPEVPPTPIDPVNIETVSVPGLTSSTLTGLEMNWDPSVSADGRWVAFASSVPNLIPRDTNNTEDIFVYSRETRSIERVSVSTGGIQGNASSFDPSISGDGRYVVFTSFADNLAGRGAGECEFWRGVQPSCPEVFLHDRQEGITKRISPPVNDGNTKTSSFAPVISNDGSTIAFWSSGEPQASGEDEICTQGGLRNYCVDLYLFDRHADTFERIRIGRSLASVGDLLFGNITLSISGDGRQILLLLFASDSIAKERTMTNKWDLFVYDRQPGEFLPVNVTSDGLPGNNPSYAGSLSATGRWVAFSSSASNLVPGDQNDKVDFFVRDLTEGTTNRIMLRSAGGELSDGFTSGERFLEIPQISADGRWILVLSDATDLSQDLEIDCEFPPTCYNVYLHDRVNQTTQAVNPATTRFFPFASLSDDGRWIAYNADSQDCPDLDICTDIFIYDREAQQTTKKGLNNLAIIGFESGWRLLHTLTGHEGWVNSVAFSPDGHILVSGGTDGQVRIWSVQEGELLDILSSSTRSVIDLSISPDGSILAAGASDGTVYLWRHLSGQLMGVLDGHPGVVRGLAFSPDGHTLAVAALRTVWLWNLETRTVTQRIPYPGSYVFRVAFSPDGELLAAAPSDSSVWIHDSYNGRTLTRLAGHGGRINDLVFSRDGSYLVTASEDHTAILWSLYRESNDSLSAEPVFRVEHNDWIRAVAFNMNGATLATGSYDGTIRLWDLEERSLEETLLRRRQNQVLSVAFSPVEPILAGSTVRGDIYLWHLNP
jgi:WD40 repeat protein/DNA-directed RNA polymerase specialized sigma24 family protein